jgi:hypothetical protein
MHLRTRTRTRTTHSVEVEGVEVPLTFEPVSEDNMMAERVGDHLVIAYLVQDNDGSGNPMTDGDCQGDLYTHNEGVITDDESELRRALRVDSYDQPDIDHLFACDPYIGHRGLQVASHCLRDIAALEWLAKVEGDFELFGNWLEVRDLELEEGETLDQALVAHRNELWQDLEDPNGVFWDPIQERAIQLYTVYWRQIVGPYVIPMHYSDGRGETSISLHDWDGDHNDLPNAVWVADKGAIDNLTPYPPGISMRQVTPHPDSVYGVFHGEVEVFRGSWGVCRLHIANEYPPTDESDLRRAAEEYAESVCSEYAKWCSGDVYGCVVEVFDLDPDVTGDGDGIGWIPRDDHDSCWNFIGSDDAMEALESEFFNPAVAALKEGVKTP